MQGNFPACLDETLVHEGGWSDHPKDPGGATMMGVTLATFRRYFGEKATKTQLRNITRAQLEHIYRDGYWDPVKGDTLARGVDLATFDYGVNSGPAAARKQLLKVIGGTAAETVKKLCARRLSIYRGLKHWATFGKGWTRRVAAIEAKAVAWATAGLKPALQAEADAAKKKAAQQTTGAGGAAAGTGGAAAAPSEATLDQWLGNDQVAAIVLGVVVVAGVGLAAWLLLRAHINRTRAAAYLEEAAS